MAHDPHPQFEDDSSSQDGDHDMATDSLAASKSECLEESPLSGDKMFDPDRYVKWKKPKREYKPHFLEKHKKTMPFETYVKLVRNHMELQIKKLIQQRERSQVKRNPNMLKDRNASQSQNICLSRYQNIPHFFQCIHYYNYQWQNISYQSYLNMCRNNIYLQQPALTWSLVHYGLGLPSMSLAVWSALLARMVTVFSNSRICKAPHCTKPTKLAGGFIFLFSSNSKSIDSSYFNLGGKWYNLVLASGEYFSDALIPPTSKCCDWLQKDRRANCRLNPSGVKMICVVLISQHCTTVEGFSCIPCCIPANHFVVEQVVIVMHHIACMHASALGGTRSRRTHSAKLRFAGQESEQYRKYAGRLRWAIDVSGSISLQLHVHSTSKRIPMKFASYFKFHHISYCHISIASLIAGCPTPFRRLQWSVWCIDFFQAIPQNILLNRQDIMSWLGVSRVSDLGLMSQELRVKLRVTSIVLPHCHAWPICVHISDWQVLGYSLL